jgi:hypothetical protein
MVLLLVAALVTAQDVGVQKVVAAISVAARENAARPAGERVVGDALADLLIRRACASGQSGRSIVLGMAYALEPSSIITRYPFADSVFKNIETAEERRVRLAALGRPTLRGRDDWLAHFVVSAGLCGLVGPRPAEVVGIQKELLDAAGKENGGGSGFSFTDLNANLAGIVLAERLTGGDSLQAVAVCGTAFRGVDFLPDPRGLIDGYTRTEFEAAWGGVQDARFAAEVERLRRRAAECKGYESF